MSTPNILKSQSAYVFDFLVDLTPAERHGVIYCPEAVYQVRTEKDEK